MDTILRSSTELVSRVGLMIDRREPDSFNSEGDVHLHNALVCARAALQHFSAEIIFDGDVACPGYGGDLYVVANGQKHFIARVEDAFVAPYLNTEES